MELTIRPLDRDDKDGWLALWRAYHAHYGDEVSADLTFTTFDRLVDRTHSLRCRIALTPEHKVVGFVNYFLHDSKWQTRESCFIEDIFVGVEARRQGVGQRMLQDIHRIANINRWGRLYMAVPGTDDGAVAFFRATAEESDWIVFDYEL